MQYDNAAYDWGFTLLHSRIQKCTCLAQNTWIQQARHIPLLYLKDKFHIFTDRHKWSRDFSKNILDNSRLFYSRIAICMNKHSKGTKLHCMLYLENNFLRWRCFSLYHDVTMQKKADGGSSIFFFKTTDKQYCNSKIQKSSNSIDENKILHTVIVFVSMYSSILPHNKYVLISN